MRPASPVDTSVITSYSIHYTKLYDFTGIIQALREYREQLRSVGVRIYVRRGGPNYEAGLRNLQQAADDLGLPIEVYGPETHMTDVARMALSA